MPPKKKRGVVRKGGPGRGKRGKMEPLGVETIPIEDPSLAEIGALDEPETIDSPIETQVRNHKSFGKYRYLHDNSNNSANTKSGESEAEDLIFIIEEQEAGDYEQQESEQDSPTAIVNVDEGEVSHEHDAHHYSIDDDVNVIVYNADDNSEVIEEAAIEDTELEQVLSDRDDVVIVQEDESQKSSESMFEVMCIVEDDNSASAIPSDIDKVEAAGNCDGIVMPEVETVEEEKIQEVIDDNHVERGSQQMYAAENSEEHFYDDVALDNFNDNINKVSTVDENVSNTIELIPKVYSATEISDSIENTTLEFKPCIEPALDNSDNNDSKRNTEIECTESVENVNNEVISVNPSVYEGTKMETEEYSHVDDISDVEMTTHNLQILLSKDDSIDDTVDKLQDIKITDDPPVVAAQPKTQEMELDTPKDTEEELVLSASKLLKKKGRPRKNQSQIPQSQPELTPKPAARRTKAEKKMIIPTPIGTPEKISPEKTPEKSDTDDKDDGASAFVKALELADKAAQKKIAKQKEAKAKKIDKAKRSKQLSKASKKAAALAAAADKQNTTAGEEDDENSIRRSSRIKTITNLKKSSRGKGLVKSRSLQDIDGSDNSNSAFGDVDKTGGMGSSLESAIFSSTETGQEQPVIKPVKVKSRWRRSSELEMNSLPNTSANSSPTPLSRSSSLGADSGISVSAERFPVDTSSVQQSTTVVDEEQEALNKLEVERRLKQFIHLKENQYLTERISCKEAKKMTCDCFLTEDDIDRGEFGCGEDCLNRLLMIECGSLCAVSERCTNKRFQKGQFAPCEAFNTIKKGLGIRAAANIPYGEFILEYVGEVLDPDKFDKRAAEYSQDKNRHYYFMALRADAIIDATQKGNISRFINHSCDPNAETQKWTVNGELRIGFFSKRTILAGEEITFDYQFQRYGKEAQKCFCEASSCRGWLGEEPEEEDDEDDEEDDEDEETEDKDLEGDKPDVKKETKKDIRDISGESPKKEPKKRVPKKERVQKKPRKEFFEDLDLDAEIETLQTTGLKNQAHTLKLSRLMVRSKEPAQRTKLLRLLRRGEFPCRRLFLDYHGLRLIHGWMTDAQQLAKQDRKMESLRLEILQTIATLPIPNKTMLQDSKVLSTVEKWSVADKTIGNHSPEDSESNSPKEQEEESQTIKTEKNSAENTYPQKTTIKDLVQIKGILPLNEDQPLKVEELQDVVQIKTEDDIKLEKVETVENYESPLTQEHERIDDVISIEINDVDEIRHSVGMADYVSPVVRTSSEGDNKTLVEELTNMFSDDEDMDISPSDHEDLKKEPVELEVDDSSSIVKSCDDGTKLIVISSPSTLLATPTKPPPPTPPPQSSPGPKPLAPDPTYDIITEIVALAQKLLEEWAGLKVVFRIPKRERIEQMKEHEREANKLLSTDRDRGKDDSGVCERRMDSRYRHLQGKVGYHIVTKSADDRSSSRKGHSDERSAATSSSPYTDHLPQQRSNLTYPISSSSSSSSSPRIAKIERRKQFTLRLEHEESERRRRQRELWRQHEQHCLLMGTDPRFTAPYDPARGAGYHCIWNPATGQWQNYATPPPAAAAMGGVYGQQQPMALPALPYQDKVAEMEEVAKVKFMGPIPPAVQLPSKWKCAKDKYGRPYYYHIRIRKAQWEPPPLGNDPTPAEESTSSTSSSDTSSLSSTSSSEDSETDDETSDTKLLIEIRNKFNRMDAQKRFEQEKQLRLEALKAEKLAQSKILADVQLKSEPPSTPPTPINTEEESLDETMPPVAAEVADDESNESEKGAETTAVVASCSSALNAAEISSLDRRLKDELGFRKEAGNDDEEPVKKKRAGLVQEFIISPRSEKDKIQFREDLKKYKENKEMLRKQKEMILEKSKQRKSSSSKAKISKHKVKKTVKLKLKPISEVNSETTKKIKETFRSAMATVMVAILNSYRKSDCQIGRITNTDDFKHLARKLTHFVMLKELKHCKSIEDLVCTDSVKSKAKEFVRKYMSKFGEVYVRPADDVDTYF